MSVPRILLVDDEREVSRMLRSSIELSGWECIVVDAPSGEDALRELGRGPVDLLVADVKLPGISGVDLVRKVRQLNPEAKVIIITGHPTEEIRKEAEDLGVVALLPKPIGTSLFLEAVASVLRQTGELRGRAVPERTKKNIRERLDVAMTNLSAAAVLLIDDYGREVARVGETVDFDLEIALPSLMTASDSALKVSSLIDGLLPGNLLYIEGGTYNLYLFNVGAFYTLVIVVPRSMTDQLVQIVEAGRSTADELLDQLSSSGVVKTSEAEQDVLEERRAKSPFGEWKVITANDKENEEPDLQEEANTVEKEDAEDFWDQAVEDSPSVEEVDNGILTYEEARKKGLLPDESE